jgi:hypothetical protein
MQDQKALLQSWRLSGEMRSERGEGWATADFKGRHFEGEIVVWAVRWYCRYGVSYRDLEQMMGERGLSVDHSTIYRWVQHRLLCFADTEHEGGEALSRQGTAGAVGLGEADGPPHHG